MSEILYCPPCQSDESERFHEDRRRSYYRCECCALVFVPPRFYLRAQAERAEYDLHQNDIDDPGYRTFLSRLATPLMARLAPGSKGLDFGCGPGPALAAMLEEAGFEVSLYDLFYHPDTIVLTGRYGFVCATEVVEHLHQPEAELQRLWGLLGSGGQLGIMTKLVSSRSAFASWHYKNDPTHVCFFSEMTWRWWALANGAELTLIGADVILLAKH